MIAISGATGALGGQVARLLAGPARLRLLVRDPARAPRLPNTEIAQAAYAERARLTAALAGCRVVLMVSAGESATRRAEHESFVQAAVAAGVRHLVYTSFAAAAPDAEFTLARDHWHTETAIRASGLDFTILRDNFYADLLPAFADADGVLCGPAGDGRCSFVARADIARAAAAVLRAAPAHRGMTYTLTGPSALTLTEAAEEMTRALGRNYTYRDEPVEQAYARRRATWPGEPDWQYDAWVSTYTAIATGALAAITENVELLTGLPATDLATALRPAGISR